MKLIRADGMKDGGGGGRWRGDRGKLAEEGGWRCYITSLLTLQAVLIGQKNREGEIR